MFQGNRGFSETNRNRTFCLLSIDVVCGMVWALGGVQLD
jgi:hypothetical protein